MKSKFLNLPLVLVIYPSKSSYTVTVVVTDSTVCMSDAGLQSYRVNIVKVVGPSSASCVSYTRSIVVLYGQSKLVYLIVYDDIIERWSVHNDEVDVSSFAYCSCYKPFKVVSYGHCNRICSNCMHVRC